jgi:hypothetical protein
MSDDMPSFLTPEESKLVQEQQKSRSRALGVILFALAALFFLITIVKIGFP